MALNRRWVGCLWSAPVYLLLGALDGTRPAHGSSVACWGVSSPPLLLPRVLSWEAIMGSVRAPHTETHISLPLATPPKLTYTPCHWPS